MPQQDAELARRIAAARESIGDVVLPDNELRRIAALCAAFDVDGMRADLVVARTAVAHAAWRGAQTVGEEDIRVAAELALPHRRRRDPFDDPGLDPEQLDDAMAQTRDQADDPDPDPEPPDGGGSSDDRFGLLGTAGQFVIENSTRALLRRESSEPGRWWCPAWGRARQAGGRVRATARELLCRRHRKPTKVTECISSRHCWPLRVDSNGRAVRVWKPTTYAARSGKAAKATW